MHQEQLLEHGGLPGIKDDNALEAALAAAYLYGITRNNPFSDGNKRTGFLAAFTFLWINGYAVEAEQSVVIAFVLSVAAGEIDEEGATRFFRDFCVPLD